MALWTDAGVTPAHGLEGLLIDAPENGVTSHVAESAVRAGFLVEIGTDIATTQKQVQPLTAAPVADVDAIMAGFASAAAEQVFTTVAAGNLDGVIGNERIYPPRAITVDLDASADWDGPAAANGTVITVSGEDANGKPLVENLFRPVIGAVAYSGETTQAFSRVSAIKVSAGAGVGGTGTVGVSPNQMSLGKLDYPGIACYDVAREPSATAAVTFDALETLSVVKEGLVWAVAVAAVVPGDPVLVRVTAGGGGLGSLYGVEVLTSGGDYGLLLGARWRTAAGVGELAVIELGG